MGSLPNRRQLECNTKSTDLGSGGALSVTDSKSLLTEPWFPHVFNGVTK